MTTNQTIDGVPGLRALLAEIYNHHGTTTDHRDRLCALLMKTPAAQPQGEPVAHTMKTVMQAYENAQALHLPGTSNFCAVMAKHLNKYAEQPAPVAAVRMCDCNQGRMECNGKCKPEAPKSGPCKFEQVSTCVNVGEGYSLVAVVLPEHRDSSLSNPNYSHARGWNDCLDEVTRLNAKE